MTVTLPRAAPEADSGVFAARLLGLCAFALPLLYGAALLAALVHALGHLVTAWLADYRAIGFQIGLDARSRAVHGLPSWPRLHLLAGPLADTLVGGLLLALACWRRERSPLLRLGLLLASAAVLVPAWHAMFWGAVHGRPGSDLGQLVTLVGRPAGVGLAVLFAGVYLALSAVLLMRVFRTVEDVLGPLSVRRAGVVLGVVALVVIAWHGLHSGRRLMRELRAVIAVGGLFVHVMLLGWVWDWRRRVVPPVEVTARQWRVALAVSWTLCLATTLLVGVWWRHGVRWTL